jgi:hypothetical protein
MRWFVWKWWRFASAPCGGSSTLWDHEGRWRCIIGQWWVLVARGEEAPWQ